MFILYSDQVYCAYLLWPKAKWCNISLKNHPVNINYGWFSIKKYCYEVYERMAGGTGN